MTRWLVFLLAASLNAQIAPLPKYKVVKAGRSESTVEAMNALADQGYRLLVAGRRFILRLEVTPPDTYRYLAMRDVGGPVKTINWINEQGARGYRWLPEAGVMEKQPHPRNYEYASAILSGWKPKKMPSLAELIRQGYSPMGVNAFETVLGPRDMRFVLERELGAKPGDGQPWETEAADAMRAGNAWKQVDTLSKQGYCYFGPFVSGKGGGQAVLMEKCRPGKGPFEYRHFDVHNLEQLTKELNDDGRDGFRVLPTTLPRPPHLMEHLSGSKENYSYHVILEKDPAALEKALNAPDQESYVPVGYVWRSGFSSADEFLVLEKTSTAAAGP